MAEKKKAKKVTSAKTSTKVKAAPSTKMTQAAKKVDIVEEAKKELKKMEAEQERIEAASSKNKFAWSTFIGAVLLTAAAFILGGMIKENMQKRAINKYLNELITGLGGGMTVEEITDLKDTSGLYQFKIKFSEYDDQFTSAITKDGKYFFSDMSLEVPTLLEEIRAAGDQTNTAKSTLSCDDITKTDSPLLEIYVSSDCSHCHDLETQIASAVSQVPALAKSIKLHYVGGVNENNEPLSLFDDTEAGQENLRQACIQSKSPASFWSYIGCMSAGGESDTCQQTANVATAAVNQCMTDGSGVETIIADNEAATSHNVSGTPTLYINDTEQVSDGDFGGRVPESIKKIICCGSTTESDFCSQTLTQAK